MLAVLGVSRRERAVRACQTRAAAARTTRGDAAAGCLPARCSYSWQHGCAGAGMGGLGQPAVSPTGRCSLGATNVWVPQQDAASAVCFCLLAAAAAAALPGLPAWPGVPAQGCGAVLHWHAPDATRVACAAAEDEQIGCGAGRMLCRQWQGGPLFIAGQCLSGAGGTLWVHACTEFTLTHGLSDRRNPATVSASTRGDISEGCEVNDGRRGK